jgi:hypothetical protein
MTLPTVADETEQVLRTRLGDARFVELCAEGTHLAMDAAIALARAALA